MACRWNVKIILLMKKRYQLVMVFIFSIFMANVIEAAAVRVSPSAPLEAAASMDSERMEKAKARLGQNGEKYEKRLKRLERKMEKRGLAVEDQSQDVWNDGKFRLGLLLLLVAIGLAIIGAIISLAGLFSFMAGLFALAGVILLIWSLVENYG